MLTDPKRGPFTIDVFPVVPQSVPLIWFGAAERITWSWRLIGADGTCWESGSGYVDEADARRAAAAVRDNEAV